MRMRLGLRASLVLLLGMWLVSGVLAENLIYNSSFELGSSYLAAHFQVAERESTRLHYYPLLPSGDREVTWAEVSDKTPGLRLALNHQGWADREWHHLCLTWRIFSGGEQRYLTLALYADGELQARGFREYNAEEEPTFFYVANLDTIGYWPWRGPIDELKIFDQPLSPEQVKRLYETGQP